MDYTWLIIFRESKHFVSINILFVEKNHTNHGNSERRKTFTGLWGDTYSEQNVSQKVAFKKYWYC